MKRLLFIAALLGAAFWIGPPSGASVPTPLPAGAVAQVSSAQGWQAMELAGLKVPDTASNVQALTVWAQSEGVVERNNPLASGNLHPGATVCIAQCVRNSTPIYAYDTMADGVTANVNFLYGSNYDGVRAAFRASAGLMGIWRAINQSKWCSGCQGGLYPVYLYRAAESVEAPTISPVP